jgi:hypothetical protein
MDIQRPDSKLFWHNRGIIGGSQWMNMPGERDIVII